MERILWWLGFRAFSVERAGSIPSGGIKILQAEWSQPNQKKDGDLVMVIFYNEGQVTEFEKSTVKVKCVLKTQGYLRAVAILTGADRVLYTRREFLVFRKNGNI